MAVCGLGSAGGVSTAVFFSQALEPAHQPPQFSEGLSFVPAAARTHGGPRDSPCPWKSPVHSALAHGGQQQLPWSLCPPCCLPIAREIDITLENISSSSPPPPISGMYHFQQNCCQEKFLRLEFFVHVWKSHLGGTISQHLGQGNGGTSDGLFQMQISDLNFPYV